MNDEAAEFQLHCRRVETLTRALEDLPDTAAREAARELIRSVFALHAVGLRRFLELLAPDQLAQHAGDSIVSAMLLLHGIHPLPPAERIARVLEANRPQFHSIGGDVELIDATENAVRLRLRGNPAAERTLRALAQELSIEAVPDVEIIEFEEAWDRPESGRVALPLIHVAAGEVR